MSRPRGNQRKPRLDVVVDFGDQLQALSGKSARTAQTYADEAQRFSEALAATDPDITLDEATSRSVRAYIVDMHKKGLSASRRRVALYALRAYYAWRIEQGYIDSDPTAGIKIPQKKAAPVKPYSSSAVLKILDQVDHAVDTAPTRRERLRAEVERVAMHLLRYTGLRVSELADVKILDLDLGALELTVTNGKGDKPRTLPLAPGLGALLRRYLDEVRPHLPGDVYLLSNPYGFEGSKTYGRLVPRAVSDITAKYGRKAGVQGPYNPHRWRHSFCTDLVGRGADVETARQAMGHSDIATTLIYLHLDDETRHAKIRNVWSAEEEQRRTRNVRGPEDPPAAA